MKTIFITGNHPRHIYIVKSFAKYFKNFMWLIEKRKINIHHERLNTLSKTYKDHIDNFKHEENKLFFESKNFEQKNKNKILYLDRKYFNNKKFNLKIQNFIKDEKPKYIFTYGCQKIDIEKIEKFNINIKCFNVHGGLLPKYKGVNTNFWPHINFESNLIGLTLHKITKNIDSGDIFFQTSVNIKKNDTINSLSCRAVENFGKIVPKKIFHLCKEKKYSSGIKFNSRYKTYKKKDFKVKFIKIAYKNFKKFLYSKNVKYKTKLINIKI